MSDQQTIPTPIRRYLRRFVVMQRCVRLLTVLGQCIAWISLCLFASLLADRALGLPSSMRLAVLVVTALGALLILFKARTIFAPVNWLSASAQIESHDSRFAGRLETVVSQMNLPARLRGSPELIEKIASETGQLTAYKSRQRLVSLRPLVKPYLVIIVTTLTAASLWQMAWLDLPTLIRRQLTPMADIRPATTTQLIVRTRDADVPEGQSITIVAGAKRVGGGGLTIRLSSDRRDLFTQPMVPGSGGEFSYTIPTVDRDWQYQIVGGNTASDPYRVRVLRTPGVMQFRIHYRYPAYMGLEPSTELNCDGVLRAPVGSIAAIELTCTEPLASAAFVVDGQRVAGESTSQSNVWVAAIPIRLSGPYQLQLKSQRGVVGYGPSGMAIAAAVDRAPLATWLAIRNSHRLKPGAMLLLPYHVSDDYGISSSAVIVRVNGEMRANIPLQFKPMEKDHSDVVKLDSSSWQAGIGDVVTLSLRASDSLDQTTTASSQRIVMAPYTVDEEAAEYLSELDEAGKLAKALAAGLGPESGNGGPEGAASLYQQNAQLARAADIGTGVAMHLTRVILHGSDSQSLEALASLVDRATICTSQIAAMAKPDRSEGPDAIAFDVAPLAVMAKVLNDAVIAFGEKEQAEIGLADLHNHSALTTALAGLNADRAETLRDALLQVRADLDAAIQKLGLDPADPQIEEQLLIKGRGKAELAEWLQAPDFGEAARQWESSSAHANEFPFRLLAACYAEAASPKGDIIWARDLNLAATAARAWRTAATTGPAGDSRPAFAADMKALQEAHRQRVAALGPARSAYAAAEAARYSMRQLIQNQTFLDDPERIARQSELLALESALRDQYFILPVRPAVNELRYSHWMAGVLRPQNPWHDLPIRNLATSAESSPTEQAIPASNGMNGYQESLRIYFQMLEQANR